MPHIVLTGEQVRVLEQATTPVEICDGSGRILGQVPASTEEQIIERIKQVLTGEQVRVLEQATTPVEVRDGLGRILGQIPAPTEEQIIERIKRNRSASTPRYPAEQVEKRLRRLEEIRQREGMDETTMPDLLRRMRAGAVAYTP